MVRRVLEVVGDFLRVWPMAVIAAALILVVWHIAPMQLGILAYKGALLSGGAYLGYWIDRLLFPYDRPHEPWADAHSEYRRAIVIAASVMAVGLSA